MRISIICFLIFFSFIGCQDESELNITVQYLDPGPCCSNMELINQEPIYSDLVGYSETLLAAVNINELTDLVLEDGDLLKIQFVFTNEQLPCNIICNRQHGIPINILSAEKI
jgi:hypothetical protein